MNKYSSWTYGHRVAPFGGFVSIALMLALTSFVTPVDARHDRGGDRHHDWHHQEPTEELTCGVNEHVESVKTDEGQPAVEEVFHYEDVLTPVPDTCERVERGSHYEWGTRYFKDGACTKSAWFERDRDYVLVKHDDVLVSTKIVDVEGKEAVPPTYEDQCVCDTGYKMGDGEDAQCVPEVVAPVTCDAGMTLVDGVCVPVQTPPVTCEEGKKLVDNVCVSATTDTTPTPQAVTGGGSGGGGGACLNCGTQKTEEKVTKKTTETSKKDDTDKKKDDEGEVLGASCVPLFTTYMREGQENSRGEVIKLQAFLNHELGKNVAITGVFDHATTELVNEFQTKYWQDVLLPWVPFGLASEKTPTGYMFKTTQRKLNMLACPALNLPMPDLKG